MNAVIIPVVGIPRFVLSIGNTEVSPQLKADITSVQVTEDVDKPTMLSFSVSLWDAAKQSLKEDYLSQFALGMPIEFSVGINEVSPLFTGEVISLEPQFGGIDGGDTLKVRAYNRLIRLQFGTHQRTFEQMTYSEIASSIAEEVGLSPEVEDTKVKQRHVVQNNKSNLKFLLDLKPKDYEVFVEDKSLYFRKTQESQGHVLSLTYRQDLLEFTPRQRAITQGVKVEVRGWDVVNKKPILGTSGPGDEVSKMGGQQTGAEISASAFTSATRTISHEPVADADEATQVAKAWFNRQQENFIEADGECAGSPLLRAGKTIEISGVGKVFSGIYYLTSVTHQIGTAGYKTRFRVRRNAS